VDTFGIIAGVVVGGLLGFGGTTWNQHLQARNDQRKEVRAAAHARATRLRAAYATVLESYGQVLLLARAAPPEERMVAEIHALGDLSAKLTLEPDRFVPTSSTATVADRLAELVPAVQAYYSARPDGTRQVQEATRQAREAGWDQLVEAMNVHLAQLEEQRGDADVGRPWWALWQR
jgi:hypothetical protein